MKAITRIKYGGPEVLRLSEVDRPTPKSSEVLIKVYATTVNRTDCGILTGTPSIIKLFTGWPKPVRSIPGSDFAGKVEAIGSEVKDFKVGDRVWGFDDSGSSSNAEYLTFPEKKGIAKIPEGISFTEVVACAEGAHYAYNYVRRMDLPSKHKVLVNGATGAIGSAAVQILKHQGAYVAAVGNTKNRELVCSLGADKFWDYEKEDFTKDEERYHYVLDAVGKSTFGKCKAILEPGGIYMSSELGPGAENLYLPLLTRFRSQRVKFPVPIDVRGSILYINSLLEQGAFRAVIDRTYPLEDIQAAYEYVQSGQKTGNVVLEITADT